MSANYDSERWQVGDWVVHQIGPGRITERVEYGGGIVMYRVKLAFRDGYLMTRGSELRAVERVGLRPVLKEGSYG